jgi:hypothetical protein
MTNEDLVRLATLVAKMTPGPWRRWNEPASVRCVWRDELPAGSECIESGGTQFAFGVAVAAVPRMNDADTDGIVALRNAADGLIAFVLEHEQSAAWCRADVERFRADRDASFEQTTRLLEQLKRWQDEFCLIVDARDECVKQRNEVQRQLELATKGSSDHLRRLEEAIGRIRQLEHEMSNAHDQSMRFAGVRWCECGQPWKPAAGLFGTTEETRCPACVLKDMVAELEHKDAEAGELCRADRAANCDHEDQLHRQLARVYCERDQARQLAMTLLECVESAEADTSCWVADDQMLSDEDRETVKGWDEEDEEE